MCKMICPLLLETGNAHYPDIYPSYCQIELSKKFYNEKVNLLMLSDTLFGLLFLFNLGIIIKSPGSVLFDKWQ